MNVRHPFLQAAILIGGALVVAIVANGFAPPTRRLVLPGHYPNALQVPESAPPPIAATPQARTETMAATVMIAQPPAPTATTTIAPVTTTTMTSTSVGMAAPGRSATGEAPATQKPAMEKPAPPVADALARFAAHPDKPYIEIGGDDVALLHARGVLFLDARRTSVFEEGHIAGARSFPVWEADVDDRVNALFNERSDPADQNKPIVIYCSGGACEDSHMLAQKLWAIQFNNVYVYKDGFPDWQKRGGSVHTGAQP
jgi:rhodanese-related sulfurtransferase